jgi:hypothetical protein
MASSMQLQALLPILLVTMAIVNEALAVYYPGQLQTLRVSIGSGGGGGGGGEGGGALPPSPLRVATNHICNIPVIYIYKI